jgi:hypothetical protein
VALSLKGKHLGGLSDIKTTTVSVLCNKNEVVVVQGFKKHRIPWSKIVSMEVDGAKTIDRRITATRLVTLGVFALAAQKKKTQNAAFLTIKTTDGQEGVFDLDTPYPEAQKYVIKFTAKYGKRPAETRVVIQESQATGNDDLLTKLARLGELRDSGVLTDEEFEGQKAKLLS